MKKRWKKVAEKNIAQLLSMAKKKPESATRYTKVAWKTKLRYKADLTKAQKLQLCRHCQEYIPADKLRVRLHRRKLIRLCPNCKKF